MSNKFHFIFPVLAFILVFLILSHGRTTGTLSGLKQKHMDFLEEKAPQRGSIKSRVQRIRQGLPPNDYYEMMAYLTMNPSLGYPEPYKVREIYRTLQQNKSQFRTTKAPGESEDNRWFSRGPDNVGGRTRVLLFDPTDASGKRALAGAVSGGLWVNDDITSENSPWKQLPGLSSNLNVTSLTVDPRDRDTWYVGTGEQYTGGDVIGTGVYKTTDAGVTWTQVMELKEFSTPGEGNNALVVGGLFYINDVMAWDNGTQTEIYVGVSTHIYANSRNPTDFLGYYDRGLYRSMDGGATWEQLKEGDSYNDFEVDAEGDLWVATTYSPGSQGSRGGKIFQKLKNTDGPFSLITTIPGVLRTEIEASQTNPDKFYVLAESASSEEADMYLTLDSFNSLVPISEPDDADTEIPDDDFARGQAFYNLVIESDPTNDNIVYAGGIDLFRSSNSGSTWQQISKWSNNNDLEDLPVSYVHADQHVISFRPGNPNQALFGHDGGVSFGKDLAKAGTSDVFIPLEKNYTTTQFYSVAVAPDFFAGGDYFLGGTQDNGTQLIENGNPSSVGILGGDGAHSFYDQVETDYLIANLVYNDLILLYDYSEDDYTLIAYNDDPEESEGFFINPQGLDSNLDKLYSNGPEGVLYRYDGLPDLTPLGDNEISEEREVAVRKTLSNALLDASISAIAVSPYSTTTSTVLLGLINSKLLIVENAQGDPSEAQWREISSPQFLGSVSDIELGSSENEIYVTFYNFGVENIWYTSNALDAQPVWKKKEGNLPDLPVLSILPNPDKPDEVIIGTELGVWSTENFSSSSPVWTHSYNGMSDVKVTDLDLKKGTLEVFAATYGRGLFSGSFAEENSFPTEPNEQAPIFVYPTISQGSYRIIAEEDFSNTEIYIFDLQGQLVFSDLVDLEANMPYEVDLSYVASGLYFLKISGEVKLVEKLIRK